jgi:2-polyprenyl-3-methyl-5-hydroxy-6-metoxy-1,4-benzoquinol methylase
MYDEIISLIPKNASLLDVGCGIGYLMDRARTEARCDVYGIDISGRAIGHILAKGMKGKVCSVPPIPYPSDTFDVVTSTQLLEHSRKPLAIIREIFRVTRPGGTICISVPEDCCHPDEVAEHNHLFTRDELHYLTRQASQYSAIRFISVCEKGSDTIRLLAVCRKDNS